MEKKIILITGATGGLGKETAIQLARQGHTVIVHGRSKNKTQTIADEIKQLTGNTDIQIAVADLGSFAEIQSMVSDIEKHFDHLDVLINNAGAQFWERELTTDGREKTMNTNVFAPFLLTYLLLPLLHKATSARVVTVSSASHSAGGEAQMDDIESEKNYVMTTAYGLSKRYIIWVMRHFVKYAKEQGYDNITFNCAHPASTPSDLGRDVMKKSKLWNVIMRLWGAIMTIPVEKAAYGSVWLATSPEAEGKNDLYVGPKGIEKPSEKSYSASNEQAVWNYCMQVTKDFRK